MLDHKFVVYFLVILVLLSKNFIIINEETLVLISFIVFVITCKRYGSKAVEEMLLTRRADIQTESLQLNRSTQLALQKLISNYKNQAAFYDIHSKFTEKMNRSSSDTMKSIAGGYSSHFLTLVCTQFRQKVETLQRAEKAIEKSYSQRVAKSFRSIVLAAVRKRRKAGRPTFIVASVKKVLTVSKG